MLDNFDNAEKHTKNPYTYLSPVILPHWGNHGCASVWILVFLVNLYNKFEIKLGSPTTIFITNFPPLIYHIIFLWLFFSSIIFCNWFHYICGCHLPNNPSPGGVTDYMPQRISLHMLLIVLMNINCLYFSLGSTYLCSLLFFFPLNWCIKALDRWRLFFFPLGLRLLIAYVASSFSWFTAVMPFCVFFKLGFWFWDNIIDSRAVVRNNTKKKTRKEIIHRDPSCPLPRFLTMATS